MTLEDLKRILSIDGNITLRQARALTCKPLTKDTIDAVKALRQEYGAELDKWPQHFLAILKETPPAHTLGDTRASNNQEGSALPEIGNGVTHLSDRKKPVRFAELTDEDEEFIRGVHAMDATARVKFNTMFERFGIGDRTTDHWYNKLGLTLKIKEPELLKEASNRERPTKKTILVSCAQSATPVHKQLWENIQAYAEFLDAEVRVIPTRYRNPTSVFPDLDQDWWDPLVVPYLDKTNHQLGPNLVILGALKVQPTAEYPLQGLNALTNGSTAIIGHPKMHLLSIPVLEGEHKQRLWSTGSVTLENYTDSKAGAKGESHQVFGCVIVELDGDSFHIRHIPATESGDMIDLWNVVSGGEVGFSDKITAAVLGDVHLGETSDGKMDATVDLLNMLKPGHIMLHDLFDGYSVNHHELKNPIKSFHRIRKGQNLIKGEVEEMIGWLHWFTQEFSDSEIVVVKSNHCDFFDRHIASKDWKHDLHNAQWYVKCLDHLLSDPESKGLVPYFIEQEFGDRITCLTRDTSYRPGAYQLANHGDLGAGGSRGTPLQYSKLSTKQITGHTHSPGRINGLLVAGTSTHLRVGYNQGPCSWGWADVIEYKNGKATHIIYDENFKFTTQKYPV